MACRALTLTPRIKPAGQASPSGRGDRNWARGLRFVAEGVDAEFGVGEELLGLLAELDASLVGVDGLVEREAAIFQFGEDCSRSSTISS